MRKKHKMKYFVSIIWGYSTHMYGFSPEENYHLHILKVAQKKGYKPVAIVKVSKSNMEQDPNFYKNILVIDYKNFFCFLVNVIKFSFKSSIFYVNSYEWQSFLIPFLARKTIFMAHTQPQRKDKKKQLIQNFVYKFFTLIRLNNQNEKEFLLKQGINDNKLVILPLVVSQKVFRKIDSINRDDFSLVCFGNVTKKKNIITIIKAFELSKNTEPKLKLNIIGNLWDEEVELFVDKSEFKHDIIFHGFLPNEKLVVELNKNSLYLNSSFDEGQCVAVYDAALCGLSLCLPNIMSFTSVFKDKAFFHNVQDYEKLSKNIIKYLNNFDLRKSHNEACVDMIKKEYNNDIIENKTFDLISRFE